MRMRQTTYAWAGIGVVALGVLAACASSSDTPDLHATANAAASEGASGTSAMPLRVAAVHVDKEFGVPSFAWLSRLDGTSGASLLASKNGVTRTANEVAFSAAANQVAFSAAANQVAFSAAANQVAFSALRGVAKSYKLNERALAATKVTTLHDTGKGVVVARFTQELDGIELFHSTLNMALTRDLEPVAASGFLATVVKADATKGFALAGDVAVANAFNALTGATIDGAAALGTTAGAYDLYTFKTAPGFAARPARVKKVYYPQPKSLEAGYYVELNVGAAAGTDARMVAFVISASSGKVLFRKDLSANDSFSYRVWAEPDAAKGNKPLDGPMGNLAVPHPTGIPDQYAPAFIAPNLVSLANAPFSKNDPWLAAGATKTSGNNVNAYADLKAPDGFGTGDLTAEVTAPGVFDRTINMTTGPSGTTEGIKGVVTQLFYDINFMHDYYYDAGWDEKSFNPQVDNLGRGGVGGDPVLGEAQDYSGRNNANANTPADGASPVIQMYLFDGASNPKVIVTAPAGVAGTYASQAAAFAPASFTTSGTLVLANDGSTTSTNTTAGTPSDGCQAFVNAAAITGKIALVDRGACDFITKVTNAQAAGAIGVVIVNNVAGAAPSLGAAQGTPESLPTLSLSQTDGAKIKAALAGGVTVTLQRDKSIDRDGALDTAIITHEWGHILSNRLVGNGTGLSSQQAGGMGEGWSDFVALTVTVRPDDLDNVTNPKFSGVYATGGYAMGGQEPDAFYYGVRRYPYSTNMLKNPLTFKHISNGTALPVGPPVAFGEDGASNAEVHNTGEVWATMLWECYASLLADTPRLTFDEANKRMRAYLVASLKLTPNAPTILEARDAVLAAAYATDATDFALFAAAFAKRGAGTGAIGPDRTSQDQTPVVESYITGNDLEFISAKLDDSTQSCDNDGILDNGEKGLLTVTLKNSGTGPLAATTAKVTASDKSLVFDNGGAITFPPSKPYETVTATVTASLAGAGPVAAIEVTIDATDPKLATTKQIRGVLDQVYNSDSLAASSATDDVETKDTLWTNASDKALSQAQVWTRRVDAGNTMWSLTNSEEISDQSIVSPAVTVAATGNLVVTFKHRYSFEANADGSWDGGVLELSADGGKTWKDVGATATPAYPGTITAAFQGQASSNPLKGLAGYVGESTGYPAFITETLDLGTTYANQTVQIRFRAGTDEGTSTAVKPWDVDDIAFKGIVGTPFSSRVGDACGHPVAPAADGGTTAGATATGDASGGCSCTTTGSRSSSGTAAAGGFGLLSVLAAAFTRLRRSRRSRDERGASSEG